MTLSNSSKNSLLLLLFNNTAWANFGDAAGILGSGAAGSLYVALHTADPGEAGAQNTSEATFTSYTRIGVVRTAGGWTVVGDSVTNTGTITFPTCTGGTNTITHFSIGRLFSGAGQIIVSGELVNQVVVSLSKPVATFPATAITITAN